MPLDDKCEIRVFCPGLGSRAGGSLLSPMHGIWLSLFLTRSELHKWRDKVVPGNRVGQEYRHSESKECFGCNSTHFSPTIIGFPHFTHTHTHSNEYTCYPVSPWSQLQLQPTPHVPHSQCQGAPSLPRQPRKVERAVLLSLLPPPFLSLSVSCPPTQSGSLREHCTRG